MNKILAAEKPPHNIPSQSMPHVNNDTTITQRFLWARTSFLVSKLMQAIEYVFEVLATQRKKSTSYRQQNVT